MNLKSYFDTRDYPLAFKNARASPAMTFSLATQNITFSSLATNFSLQTLTGLSISLSTLFKILFSSPLSPPLFVFFLHFFLFSIKKIYYIGRRCSDGIAFTCIDLVVFIVLW
jgi:hypothetical protein